MLTSAANPSHAARPLKRMQAVRTACTALALGLLAGCNAASDPNHPLRGTATAVGWATTVGEPKDFVRARRSGGELAYIPVGRTSPERSVPIRNPDGVKGLEAELDRQRDQSDQFARRRLPTGAYGQPLPSVAAPPRPASQTPASGGGPDSYPVSPSRMRQIRENAQRASDN